MHTVTTPSRPPARRGFSFAEVMFAVVILGIGFIMVASVFPVALQQTQATAEENAAANAARSAAEAVASAPATMDSSVAVTANQGVTLTGTQSNGAQIQRTAGPVLLYPPTVKPYALGSAHPGTLTLLNAARETAVPPAAIVVPFTGPKWDFVRANAVVPADPRFGYVAFYRRENGTTVAQLIVVAVASRQQAIFDPTTLDAVYGTATGAMPKRLTYNVSYDRVPPQSAVGGVPVADNGTAASPGAPNVPMVVAQPPAGTDRYDSATPIPSTATQVLPDTIKLPAGVPEGTFATVNGTAINYATNTTAFQGPSLARTYLFGRTFTDGTCELLPGGDFSLSPGLPNVAGVSNWGAYGRRTDAAASNDTAAPSDPRGTPTALSLTLRTNGPLQPVVGYVTISASAASATGRMTVYANGDPRDTTPCAAAGPGAFVIVADDFPFDSNKPLDAANLPYALPQNFTLPSTGVTPAMSWQVGQVNGRIFRLGAAAGQDLIAQPDGTVKTVANPVGTFDLDPSYPMRPTPSDPAAPQYSPDTIPNPDLRAHYADAYAGLRARVYVIGLPIDPTTGARGGAAQDIGCFSTYIPVR